MIEIRCYWGSPHGFTMDIMVTEEDKTKQNYTINNVAEYTEMDFCKLDEGGVLTCDGDTFATKFTLTKKNGVISINRDNELSSFQYAKFDMFAQAVKQLKNLGCVFQR